MESLLKTFDLSMVDAFMIPVGAVLFLLLWNLLEQSLFKPFLEVVEVREEATTTADEIIDDKRKQLEKLKAKYEEELLLGRIEAMLERTTMLETTREQTQKITDQAKSNAESIFRTIRDDLQRNKDQLRFEALQSADELAEQIAAKVVQV